MQVMHGHRAMIWSKPELLFRKVYTWQRSASAVLSNSIQMTYEYMNTLGDGKISPASAFLTLADINHKELCWISLGLQQTTSFPLSVGFPYTFRVSD
jgi:hypothetical protein